MIFAINGLVSPLEQTVSAAPNAPVINGISDNRGEYTGGQIPKYEKLEISFQVTTLAQNLQIPYDAAPPSGITPGIGVSVDAQFSPNNWQTIYTQPAFYYQNFDYQVKSGREWMYPNGNFAWKVRFAPNMAGAWQYRLVARDAGGTTTSSAQTFTVIASTSKGFVRVSAKDSRYFEFDDGTYFPGLGYNMNYNHVDWTNPVLNNQTNFQKMKQNGIQLIRIWLSQWAIFGSAWNPWYGIRNDYDGYLPRTGLTPFQDSPADTPSVTLKLAYSEDSTTGKKNSGSWFDACRFIGGFQAPPAVKRNTNYHIKIRYWGYDMTGPRNSAYPNYGFVAKVQNPNDGNWHTNCYEPGQPTTGIRVSAYGSNSNNWATIEGTWNSGATDFLPMFYLALENVNNINPATGAHPSVFIDSVWVQEDLGNSAYGPNIVSKPSMQQQLYFEQRNSFAFDKVVELAHQNDVYLKPVILEKNEEIQNSIDANGNFATFDNNHFYGSVNGWSRPMTAVRWLQQAWWRYLQARWGYSPNIHSWELVNEGDPWNGNHYGMADEFGKYLHCTVFGITVGYGDGQKCGYDHPNDHLVTTSFWDSFPRDQFWANSKYPNLDYADYHQYIPRQTDATHFYDTALATFDTSMWLGAKQSGGAGKPVMRGETGLTENGTEPSTTAILADTTGVWLHNLVWGQINPGGLLESYWYEASHIYTASFDHRPVYKTFNDFIKTSPLGNGNYQDASAGSTNGGIRVWGQKDSVNGQAHLWIQNVNHTWKKVVDGTQIPALSSSVSIAGFNPNGRYTVQWWNTYLGSMSNSQSITANAQGTLAFSVSNLTSDVAIKILPASSTPTIARLLLPFVIR
ncbi:hypothetical protein MTYM_02148 [Methylococcales bacterium]|nr:hypothetical protein MTYM_02148 [Methylococcales bacterium]